MIDHSVFADQAGAIVGKEAAAFNMLEEKRETQ